MILYKMSIGLNDERGAVIKITELQAKDGNTYSGAGFRIAKEKILRLDTITYTTGFTVTYFTYYLEGQKEQAFELLVKAINDRMAEIEVNYQRVKACIAKMNRELSNVKSNPIKRDY